MDRERQRSLPRWTRVLGGALAASALIIYFLAPGLHVATTALLDQDERVQLGPREADDASRLERTEILETVAVPEGSVEAELVLRQLLLRARDMNVPVAISGARHSMGGHTIHPDGIRIDTLGHDSLVFDPERRILAAGAGARWSEVIPLLASHGSSVAVMQSNNSFSIGGSLSVNCHGWPFDRPPIASSVESFRIMLASGEILRCSRTENSELFSLALGGYGLFGILLDVELRVVPDECVRLEQRIVPLEDSLASFHAMRESFDQPSLVYARLCIVPDRLFDEVILNMFVPVPDATPPPLEAAGLEGLRRAIFRGSADSGYGKWLRWSAETRLAPHLAGKLLSRNQLLNEPVTVFENRSTDTTDILHEYFVPEERAGAFLERARTLVRGHGADLLNVTVREVQEDPDTFLRYADQELLAFVMLFTQSRTEEGEERMRRLTEELIEASLDCGGRYYLPYRLHARDEQFHRAYPMAREFFAKKRQYDPDLRFRNSFWERYAAESGR